MKSDKSEKSEVTLCVHLRDSAEYSRFLIDIIVLLACINFLRYSVSELFDDFGDRHDRQRWMGAGMSFSVADQARFLRERLATYIAHERSLAGVNKQMLT